MLWSQRRLKDRAVNKRNIRIAFWGWKNSFDYFQIGGTESFVRRLAGGLVESGAKVDYVMYGSSERREVELSSVFKLRYFVRLENALEFLSDNYDHIVTIYLFPLDRLKFARFRKRHSSNVRFHFVYFGWPDFSIKRRLLFAEAKLFPYNGQLFCISKRQYQYLKQRSKNVTYLMPPVPKDYFIEPEEKPAHEKVGLTFLGRIDPGKGITDVIEIFKVLNKHSKFECSVYGIYLPDDKKSLKIHNWLKQQNEINYIEIDRQAYSPNIEEIVREVLRETDIFLQPYTRLSSSIDTPLLLLEAMASLCAVITKPFGNVCRIYGESRFLIPAGNFLSDATAFLQKVSSDKIRGERKRIYERNKRLTFQADKITRIFLDALGE